MRDLPRRTGPRPPLPLGIYVSASRLEGGPLSGDRRLCGTGEADSRILRASNERPPRPVPPRPRPRSTLSRCRTVSTSRSRVDSSSLRRRTSSAAFSASFFSCSSSNFFASSNSLGTPCGLLCALRQRFHSSLQNLGVSLSRNPVREIWSALMSGYINNCQTDICR